MICGNIHWETVKSELVTCLDWGSGLGSSVVLLLVLVPARSPWTPVTKERGFGNVSGEGSHFLIRLIWR